VGHFCPPGSGSGSTDPIESGSNPQPCCKAISIEVFGEQGLVNLVTKTGKADNSLVRTCAMVAQSMANDARSVFDLRPQDALDGIASLLSVISEVRSWMVFVQY
jgi:hypothetical protein